MDPDIIELLQDARELIADLGLHEHGYMDPKARAMCERIDARLRRVTPEPKPGE